MFTNHIIDGYTYETRFIMSWIRAGGGLYYGEDIDDFREWLSSLGLSNDDVRHIVFLATNGKLELETSAKMFFEATSLNRERSLRNLGLFSFRDINTSFYD